MHIHMVPNRKSHPTFLLRESYRVGKIVHKRTLANLTKLPMDQIESLRRVLKGEKLVSVDDAFEIMVDTIGKTPATLITLEEVKKSYSGEKSRALTTKEIITALVQFSDVKVEFSDFDNETKALTGGENQKESK